ncbi:MAG: hypothetical protein Q4G59_00965 [Planctomycetia bacterium]|nr:hypothetical protein [Planctomycetia bacterium]
MMQKLNRRNWLKTTGIITTGTLLTGATEHGLSAMGQASATEQSTSSDASASKTLDPKMVSFQRALPIKYDVDVFIAGGGPAGTAAAWVLRC